jgi:hypothetical protein
MLVDYMAVLGEVYPHIEAVCFGDPFVYENIQAEGGSVLPPKDEMDVAVLERIKTLKVAELSEACRNEIISGFTSNALGQDGLYDSYEVDQLNLVGSVSAISPSPNAPNGSAMPYAVRPIVDGVVQPKVYTVHTYAQLRQVMQDGTVFKLTKLQKFNAKRDYVNFNCSTHEQVDAVTWESVEPS